MAATPSVLAQSPVPEGGGEILVVLEHGAEAIPAAAVESTRAALAAGFPGRAATVLAHGSGTGVLVDPTARPSADEPPPPRPSPAAADAARLHALGAALREAGRRGAQATVLVSAGAREDGVDWLGLLLDPVLHGGFDHVSAAYRREKLEGLLNVAILQPLTRALYGRRLPQPSGGEAVLSLRLTRALLADPDWRRDPAHAGSDAWLVAKVLTGPYRTCTSWLGRKPEGPPGGELASQALARVVEPVFHEMERHADRWQRVERSEVVPSFGEPGTLGGEAASAEADALAEVFRLGLRELSALWARVLPPATLLALRRAGEARARAFGLADPLWARIVYDFAVAYSTRSVERRQLLGALTPLYLGWVAGFVSEVSALDGPATDARAEALCQAFEREKPYAIARWRWPDGFNP
jgi:hypothetical protein